MPYEIATADLIQEQIDLDLDTDEAHVAVMQHLLEMAQGGEFTLFFNDETGKYFAVAKGQPVPIHLQHLLIGE